MIDDVQKQRLFSYLNDENNPVTVKFSSDPFYPKTMLNPSPANWIWVELKMEGVLRVAENDRFYICPEEGIVDFPISSIESVNPNRVIKLKKFTISQGE